MKKKSLKVLSCLIAGAMILENNSKSFATDPKLSGGEKDVNAISALSLKVLTAGNYVRSIKDAVQIVGFIFYVAPSLKGAVSRQLMKFSNVFNTDFIDVDTELDKKFRDEIKGQIFAKEQIKGYVHNFLEYIVAKKGDSRSESDALSFLRKNGHILYLIGESGTGKSKCAETIASILVKNQSNVKVIDASSVDSKHKESFKEQLFSVQDVSQYDSGPARANNLKSNNVGTFIYGHPKSVVIINEYDKICEKELDETLRTIVDSGIINTSGGQVLDCDEVFFIITSNEGKECFPSLFPEDAKVKDEISENSEQDEKADHEDKGNQKKETEEKEKDEQKEKLSQEDKEIQEKETKDKEGEDNKEENTPNKYGKTKAKHDVSFASRLFVVPFERLNKEDMKEVAKSFFEDKSDFYEKKFGIKLIFDDSFLKKIAEYTEDSPRGARIIVDGLSIPLSLAVSKVSNKGCSGSFKIEFLLDNGNPSFTLNRIYSKNDVSEVIKNAEKFLQEKNKIDCLSDYVFDDDEEALIDFRSYLSSGEIERLKKSVGDAKKINSAKDFEEQKESLDEIQHLMSAAHTGHRSDVKVKEKNTPWWSRAISWIEDKAARIVAQGK